MIDLGITEWRRYNASEHRYLLEMACGCDLMWNARSGGLMKICVCDQHCESHHDRRYARPIRRKQ